MVEEEDASQGSLNWKTKSAATPACEMETYDNWFLLQYLYWIVNAAVSHCCVLGNDTRLRLFSIGTKQSIYRGHPTRLMVVSHWK